ACSPPEASSPADRSPPPGPPRRPRRMTMGRLLLRGGTVVTMDPGLGDLSSGDVLVDGDTIAAVAPRIDADVDAEVIDCSGKIVVPGFIDSHRHTWEAAIRGCAPNATLDDYFVEILDTF